MDLNLNKKHLFLLTVFIITMVVGISMVAATDNTTTSATNSTSHVIKNTANADNENALLLSDNTKDNTQNKYIKSQNNKTIKNQNISSSDELQQTTNSTINIKYNTYPSLVLNGKVANLTSGNLTVGISSKFGLMMASNDSVVINKNGNWNVRFDNIAPSNYTVVVKYAGDTNHKSFINTTTVTENKQTTNSTINVNYKNSDNITVSGYAYNVTNATMDVFIGNDKNVYTKEVKLNNSPNWKVAFSNVNFSGGNYTAEVYYEGNSTHEEFTNSTTFNLKQQTDSTINAANVTYPGIATVTGKVSNITNATIVVSVNNKKETYYKLVQIGDESNWKVVFNDVILNPGEYIASVYYSGDSSHERSISSTSFFVNNQDKKTTNSTINVNYKNSDNITVSGHAYNVTNATMDVFIGNDENVYIKEVKLNNSPNWKVSFDNVNVPIGNYTVEVYYGGDSSHEEFTNRTTFNLKQQTDSTIKVANVTYPGIATVTGKVSNITNATLYVSVNNKKETYYKQVKIDDESNWKVAFDGIKLNVGKYVASVYYAGDSTHESFISSATFFVNNQDKKTTNSTINVNYKNSNNIIVSGHTYNLTNATMDVFIGNDKNVYTKEVKLNNSPNWKVSFNNVNFSGGNYTAEVYYEGNSTHEEFTNSTTFNLKQQTDSTIKVANVTYPGIATVTGKVSNITNATIVVSVNNKKETYYKLVQIGDNSNWKVAFDDVKLNPGEYVASVYYAGDSSHEKFISSATFFVKNSVTISSTKMTGKLGGIVTIKATVKDSNGNNVNTGKAVVKINDKTFGQVNVTKGLISYKLNLTPDNFGKYNYKVSFVYGENNNYNSARNKTVLTVTGYKPVINAKATNNTHVGDTITVTVNITNGQGYGARSGNVGLKINGHTYKENGKAVIVKAENGIATFKIKATNKMIGNNNITVTYSGNSQFYEGKTTMTNAFTVLSSIKETAIRVRG